MIYKRGVGPVVATALLLVVVVVSITGFQTWFGGFSSSIESDVEERDSVSQNFLRINGLYGNHLYVESGKERNVSYLSITHKNGTQMCQLTANPVRNGGMEGAKTGSDPYFPPNWANYAGAADAGDVDVVTTEKYSGSQSARVNASLIHEGVSQEVPNLWYNNSYMLKAWIKIDSGTLRVASHGGGLFVNQDFTSADFSDWKEISVPVTTPSGSSYHWNEIIFMSNGNSMDAYIDQVSLALWLDDTANEIDVYDCDIEFGETYDILIISGTVQASGRYVAK